MWLNDRLGHEVSASLVVNLDGYVGTLLDVHGVLKHWRQIDESEIVGPPSHEARGMYAVGESVVLDLSKLPTGALGRVGVYARTGASELEIQLTDDVALSVLDPSRFIAGGD
jgi:hypothetical protein